MIWTWDATTRLVTSDDAAFAAKLSGPNMDRDQCYKPAQLVLHEPDFAVVISLSRAKWMPPDPDDPLFTFLPDGTLALACGYIGPARFRTDRPPFPDCAQFDTLARQRRYLAALPDIAGALPQADVLPPDVKPRGTKVALRPPSYNGNRWSPDNPFLLKDPLA